MSDESRNYIVAKVENQSLTDRQYARQSEHEFVKGSVMVTIAEDESPGTEALLAAEEAREDLHATEGDLLAVYGPVRVLKVTADVEDVT